MRCQWLDVVIHQSRASAKLSGEANVGRLPVNAAGVAVANGSLRLRLRKVAAEKAHRAIGLPVDSLAVPERGLPHGVHDVRDDAVTGSGISLDLDGSGSRDGRDNALWVLA